MISTPLGTPTRPDAALTRRQANAHTLLWQSRVRYAIAGLVGVPGVLLRVTGTLPGSAPGLLACVGSYVAVVAALGWWVRRRGGAGVPTVAAMLAADVGCLFWGAAEVVPPGYYLRALLLAFVVLHGTEFYFGRQLAWTALGMIGAGYLTLLAAAAARGAPVDWAQEIWSLALFTLVATTFLVHYGDFRRRLRTIVSLFERAEEGDFSGTYDVAADRRPDSITMVGRAYNRVREQLATMVQTDPLSGCLNRRGFERHLEREIQRSLRHHSEMTLLALDVDHFKRVNDAHGHLVGDQVIREVGLLLRGIARAVDVVGRFGGDEFMVLLPDTGREGGLHFAERVREAVAHHAFADAPARLALTVSVGLVSETAGDRDIAHALYARADEALYAAKSVGRNGVVVWDAGVRGAPADLITTGERPAPVK